MKTKIVCFLRRALRNQDAQVLPLVAVLMIAFLGMAALVMDIGDIYCSQHELQAGTNAAAMAAAEGLSTSGDVALQNAQAYNSQSGGKNEIGNLDVTSYSATLGCVTASVASSVPCVDTGSGSKANAVQVKQTARVKLYFAALFGHPYMDITATGTGLMRSGAPIPSNTVIVVDTTQSMSTRDSSCGKSRLGCAQSGIQKFLASISPCASSGCGTATNGVYANSMDKVSLFTFPEPASSAEAANDYTCGAGNPRIVPYTYPSATGTSYAPAAGTPTYQVTGFMSNYQSVDLAGNPVAGAESGTYVLSTSSGSYVSLAVGAKSGCGMQDPGGEGTYYAGVIYAAQAALVAEQAADAAKGITSVSRMIIVSDGAATASKRQMSSAGLLSTGVYPSYNNECAQAVAAARAATAAGTTVYTIAYGSPDTGCTTDTLSGGVKSPCAAMQQMASNPSTFYSDNNQSGTSSDCYSPNSLSDLPDIFTAIAKGGFSAARLILDSDFSPS